jgi:hypothetical protein
MYRKEEELVWMYKTMVESYRRMKEDRQERSNPARERKEKDKPRNYYVISIIYSQKKVKEEKLPRTN